MYVAASSERFNVEGRPGRIYLSTPTKSTIVRIKQCWMRTTPSLLIHQMTTSHPLKKYWSEQQQQQEPQQLRLPYENYGQRRDLNFQTEQFWKLGRPKQSTILRVLLHLIWRQLYFHHGVKHYRTKAIDVALRKSETSSPLKLRMVSQAQTLHVFRQYALISKEQLKTSRDIVFSTLGAAATVDDKLRRVMK